MGSAWDDRDAHGRFSRREARALRAANEDRSLSERHFVAIVAVAAGIGCIALGWVAGSGVHF